MAREAATKTMQWAEQLKLFIAAISTEHVAEPGVHLHPTVDAVVEAAAQQCLRSWQVTMNTELGNTEDACGEYERALTLFDAAARIVTDAVDPSKPGDWTLHLNINSANQLAKLQRHSDAQAAYEALLPRCQAANDQQALVACRFGVTSCRWRRATASLCYRHN